MRSGLFSYLLVGIQLGALAVIALTGPLIARSPVLFAVQALGAALGLWAIASIRVRDLSILPDVREGAMFVRRGPYRYIRHPMYAGLLLVTLPPVIAYPAPLRIAAWSVLLIDIIVKLRHEEQLLRRAFDEYPAYQRETKRLIPFVY